MVARTSTTRTGRVCTVPGYPALLGVVLLGTMAAAVWGQQPEDHGDALIGASAPDDGTTAPPSMSDQDLQEWTGAEADLWPAVEEVLVPWEADGCVEAGPERAFDDMDGPDPFKIEDFYVSPVGKECDENQAWPCVPSANGSQFRVSVNIKLDTWLPKQLDTIKICLTGDGGPTYCFQYDWNWAFAPYQSRCIAVPPTDSGLVFVVSGTFCEKFKIHVYLIDEGQTVDSRTEECSPPYGAVNKWWYRDKDNDGHGNPNDKKWWCTQPSGYISGPADDCDDNDPNTYPGAPEKCDGKDNDCDGQIDEGENNAGCTWYYRDSDGDSYGRDNDKKCLCKAEPPYDATRAGDCNDANAAINPGANEVCTDKVDNDCDGFLDCNDPHCATDPACKPSDCPNGTCGKGETPCNCPEDCGDPPATETSCDDGIDNDCDGKVDAADPDCGQGPICGDGTCDHDQGETPCNCPEDCGDPPATETDCADGVDNDCDGKKDCRDTDCGDDPECDPNKDSDEDGYPANVDCNDNDPDIHPNAEEKCNGVDNDCDDKIDCEDPDCANKEGIGPVWYQDSDRDGLGDPRTSKRACTQPLGYVDNDDDPDDSGQDIPVIRWYRDADGDGYGNTAVWVESEQKPNGYVNNDDDCDDNDPAAYPGAPDRDCLVKDCNDPNYGQPASCGCGACGPLPFSAVPLTFLGLCAAKLRIAHRQRRSSAQARTADHRD